jgi:hypothetical protein
MEDAKAGQRKNMTSFQTVQLKRGSHVSPSHGVCVMELASMLAGERFTDRPRSVSPVIASFLRAYNDLVDDERRQDLYRYAAECVGTRASSTIETLRAEACRAWLDSRVPAEQRYLNGRFRLGRRRREAIAGRAASHAAASARRHADALALVDLLIALSSPSDERLIGLNDVESSPETSGAASR